MRAAIYFAPPPGDALSEAAARWLGRDAFAGAATREADPALDPFVAEPARYGFHATLRAPFRLRDGCAPGDVETALAGFCAVQNAFDLPDLALARLGRFLALVPVRQPPALLDLEAAVLAAFEPFRAPLNATETARRRPEALNPSQRANLARWGYPFTGAEFRFHMTLTGPLPEADAQARLEALARERFAPFLERPLRVDGLALFVEPQPGAPFTVRAWQPLRTR